jgi:AcrR family transcriptional regulator
VDNVEAIGRRERKKRQTRDRLRDAARRLFAGQGFGATTIQQIADEADVSERTFFRYFESKEDLLLPDVVALFDAIEREIRARPIDEAPLASVLEAIVAAVSTPGLVLGDTLAPVPIGADPRALGLFVKAFVDWEDRLATVLVDRFSQRTGRAPGPDVILRASVVARAAVAGARATLRMVRGRRADAAPALERGIETLRAAFAVLAAGCPNPS